MAKPYPPPTYDVPIFNPNYFTQSGVADTSKFVSHPYEIRKETFENIVITNDNIILGNTAIASTGNEIVAINGTTNTYNNAVAIRGSCLADNDFSIGKPNDILLFEGLSTGSVFNFWTAIQKTGLSYSADTVSRMRFEFLGPVNYYFTETAYRFINTSGRTLTAFISVSGNVGIPSGGASSRVMYFIVDGTGKKRASASAQSGRPANYTLTSSLYPINSINLSYWYVMSPNDSFYIEQYCGVAYTTGIRSKLQVLCF